MRERLRARRPRAADRRARAGRDRARGRSASAPTTTPSSRRAAAPPFVLAGGGRRLELRFGEGYPFTQIYAPGDTDAVAFEPMTAPANALVAAGPDLRLRRARRALRGPLLGRPRRRLSAARQVQAEAEDDALAVADDGEADDRGAARRRQRLGQLDHAADRPAVDGDQDVAAEPVLAALDLDLAASAAQPRGGGRAGGDHLLDQDPAVDRETEVPGDLEGDRGAGEADVDEPEHGTRIDALAGALLKPSRSASKRPRIFPKDAGAGAARPG